jgi:hypothetical protein
MDIQILRTTMAGGALVRAGATITASVADARLLIGMGKAIAATVAAGLAPEPEEPAAPKRKPRAKVTTDGDQTADA